MSNLLSALVALIFVAAIAICCEKPDTPSDNGGAKTVAVTGVTLNKTSISLVEGGTETLTATIAPSDATNKEVSWKSSDAAIAAVDNSGKVTAIKAGSASITVTTTDGNKTATCSVTVTSKTVSVTGVSLDKTSLELSEGEVAKLLATVSPEDATNKAVSWISSDNAIAKVDAEGTITAFKAGDADITVKTADGGKTAVCKVTVKSVKLQSIEINPSSISLKEGVSKQLEVVFTPAGFADKSVEWASDNRDVASIDETGMLHAIKPGECKIYVQSLADKTIQAICEVMVTPDLTLKGISFPYTSVTMKRNESKQLQVVFNPEYADNKKVTWKSSDTSVATVTADGLVTAVWNGEAEITATSEEGGFTATCKIIVSQEEGVQVYVRTNAGYFLNGETYQGMNEYLEQVFYDGTDLYELYIYGGILKNGTKLLNLSSSGNLCGVAAGRLYYLDYSAIYIYDIASGKTVFAQALSDDSGYRNESMAVAPDGTAYVVGYSRDVFDRVVGRLWTISKDFSITESTLYNGGLEEQGHDVAIDEEGNVWALALGDDLNLYKNGKFDRVVREGRGGDEYYLAVYGKDLYIIVENEDSIDVYKNESVIYSIPMEGNCRAARSKPLFSKNGDLYLCSMNIDQNRSYVYKNDKLLYSLDGWIVYAFTVVN